MSDKSMLGALEPDAVQTLVSRREAIAQGARVSAFTTAALAVGSVPVALGALAATARAQTPTSTIIDVLQYALLLENLEAEFYRAVTGQSSVAAFNTAFNTVRAAVAGNANVLGTLNLLRDHEVKHVAFLRQVITQLGGTPTTYAPAATFDFTGGRGTGTPGPFAPATTDVNFLLALTQAVEDTGVRAYKGQAGKLLLNRAVLTPALQIHSLEARHAARIRRIRRTTANSGTDVAAVRAAGLIKGGGAAAAGVSATGLPAAVTAAFAAIYANEQNTTHTVNNGTADVALDAASLGLPSGVDPTMAFDEPLTAVQVRDIVQPFVIPTIALPASLLA